MFIIISITISLPLQLALDVSPCQTGAVAVLIPFPIPAIILFPDEKMIDSMCWAILPSSNHGRDIHGCNLHDCPYAHDGRSDENGLLAS